MIALSVGVGAKDFRGETFYASFVLYGHRVGSRKLGEVWTNTPAFCRGRSVSVRKLDATPLRARSCFAYRTTPTVRCTSSG